MIIFYKLSLFLSVFFIKQQCCKKLKNLKMKKFNFWNNYSIETNMSLNNISLKFYLKDFWKNVMSSLNDNQNVYIFLKVRFDDNTYASLSHLQTINKSMFKDLLDIFKGFLDFKAEDYSNKTLTHIIFQYHIITVKNNKSIKTKLVSSLKENKLSTFKFKGFSFPITTDINQWGLILSEKNNIFIISKKGSKITFKVIRSDLKQLVQVILNNKKILEFTDIFGSNSTSFTRLFKNQEFIYENGSLILKKLIRKTQFITKIKSHKIISNKFLTLDIETRTLDGVIKPYCISIFNGNNATSFYLSDFKNEDEMLLAAIQTLLKGSYNKYKIYVHNLSNFDGIFLLRILSNIPNTILTPIIKDSKMISLNITWKANDKAKNFYSISFRDSYLLLPSSLRKLAKAFAVESKGIFPYLFVNDPLINLNYEGIVPDFKFYTDLTKDEYAKINLNPWSLRNETIKYCEQDCRTLWLILDKFNELIFNKYKLNIHRFPTLPSLAFGIFRCHYLIKNTIPLITGKIYSDIRTGYTGGHTDIYKPCPNPHWLGEGEKIFRYDVNSLYPFVMSKFPMPIGKPVYFEGDITQFLDKPFGFFKVEVTTPLNMNRPLLQTKVQTKGGMRTVAPLGSWNDMVFSEEMKEYQKFGYKFKVLSGYLFEEGLIFNKYVKDLYEIKQTHSKDHPMYLISKLLMNSLYGRFGMTPYLINHEIIDNSLLDKFLTKKEYTIIESINLNNGKSLISFTEAAIEIDDSNENAPNVSIPIAAAITAQARIHMSQRNN